MIFNNHRLADLLQNGAVMGRHFQPYEAHIPYLLQVNVYIASHSQPFWNFLTILSFSFSFSLIITCMV